MLNTVGWDLLPLGLLQILHKVYLQGQIPNERPRNKRWRQIFIGPIDNHAEKSKNKARFRRLILVLRAELIDRRNRATERAV
ncbi:hypothetical protein RRG08_044364 [Elysia crispata]|uniref:Uncharacterized protein n=1 Tax=Elysia crispata TaxID=231223 RepID=A0AAE1DUG0_9GAST|nr:hypothetical protein RRG08_044364 [Elysia crispata]